MKQLHNVKEEGEKKLHDVVFTKTKQWEIVKADLGAKIIDLEQELMKASSDNSALSRSLQERSVLLMKVSEEKYQVDAQVEVLKNNIQSCEREISSMKYELHVVAKELEIRNEEKNMIMKSAEMGNKQHLEDVKKVAKLEAECQRLRGLVRKRLPGPAALAQMKLEVENLGRDYGETRLRKSPGKGSGSHNALPYDCSLENTQLIQKENEFLTSRLLEMEEETKILKEALSNRHRELQASRKMCAKQVSKFRSMEARELLLNRHESHSKLSTDFHFENESNPPSLTSMSEDGIDEEMSYSDSCATALISEMSHNKMEKDVNDNKADNLHNLVLMDDFLEMERLACLSTEPNVDMIKSDDAKLGKNDNLPLDHCAGDAKKQGSSDSESSPNSTPEHASKEHDIPVLKLKSRIISILDTQPQENNMKKVLEHIGHVIQEGNEFTEVISEQSHCQQGVCEITDVGISSRNNDTKFYDVSDHDLKNAISYIHEFLVKLCKQDTEVQSSKSTGIIELSKKIEEFFSYKDRVVCNNTNSHDFVLDLIHILLKGTNLVVTPKANNGGCNGPDFIDNETLLENAVTQHKLSRENISRASSLVTHSSSFPVFSLEDFETLKLEKEKVEVDLAGCRKMLDYTKSNLGQVEQELTEIKSELAICQKSNSLAETQLKCMAESYKTLESRKEELEAEAGHLRAKSETLDYELQVERLSHQEDIVKYNELQVQIERHRKCSTGSFPSDTDNTKTHQEREIAAAAEKLAECQESIVLIGRQLHAMRNPAEQMDSSPNGGRPQPIHNALKDERKSGCLRAEILSSPLRPDREVRENLMASGTEQPGRESPVNGHNSRISASDTEQTHFKNSPLFSKHQKQKVCRSLPSSSPSNEKHGRGFRKLFSRRKIEC
ncbi:Filament-like plant protein 4 [Platanthera zijinensis]|uniref:Filament-like plant protein 4 n=1 Tax=Platanthera zijinensis TaxID=2320716 RepID=A0AAP0BNI5_9ASPA